MNVRVLIVLAIHTYRNVLLLYIIMTFLQSMAGLRIPDVLRPAINFIYDLCEPFLRLFRGLLPAMNLGGMGLDLTPMIAFIVLIIVEQVAIRALAV